MYATSLMWTSLTSPDPFALSFSPFGLIREFNRRRAPLVRRHSQGRANTTVSSLPVYRWAGHFSRWSTGEEQYLEKPILAECAAPHALSNKRNRTAKAFQTAELSITECDIFKFFHTPSTFGTGNGNDTGGFFLSGLVFLITVWMEHILGQTGISSFNNSGRDPQTSQTDTQTEPSIA
jgi:hypothetical protein